MEKTRFDKSLLLIILFFIGLGLVQVYSSSFIFATEKYDDGFYFFKKQFLFALLGVSVMISVTFMKWKYVKLLGLTLWLVSIIGIVLTLTPEFSIKAGGAARWVKLPFGLRFEPGELFKISIPFILALIFSRKVAWVPKYQALFDIFICTFPFYFLLKQPDFGTTMICVLTIFFTLFYFGLKWRFIAMGVLAAIPTFYFAVMNVPYRLARIQAFMDPWADPSNKGFQLIQSILSFHSGGLTGKGLGESQGKLFFLPEAHTDFTLAIFGEEWGLIGFVFVSLLYGYVIFRGFQISLNGHDIFAKTVALGITVTFAMTVSINMGVVLGLLPTKGLTLPFMSYGGSSLVTICIACGILLNIDRVSNALLNKNRRRFKKI